MPALRLGYPPTGWKPVPHRRAVGASRISPTGATTAAAESTATAERAAAETTTEPAAAESTAASKHAAHDAAKEHPLHEPAAAPSALMSSSP